MAGASEGEPLTRERRRQMTRAALVAAARAEFERAGFHGASLDAIAERAGFTKGAVYSNFAGKEELLIAVLNERDDTALSTLGAAGARDRSMTRPSSRNAEDLVSECSRFLHDGSSLLGLELRVHASRTPRARAGLRSWQRASHEKVEAFLRMRGGDPIGPFSAHDLTSIVLALANGLALQARADSSIDASRLLQHALRVLLTER